MASNGEGFSAHCLPCLPTGRRGAGRLPHLKRGYTNYPPPCPVSVDGVRFPSPPSLKLRRSRQEGTFGDIIIIQYHVLLDISNAKKPHPSTSSGRGFARNKSCLVRLPKAGGHDYGWASFVLSACGRFSSQ